MNTAAKRALLAAIVALLVLNGVALSSINPSSKHPAHWDKRVAPLAAFIETTRHLHFDHAVKISYLTPAAYRKRILGEGAAPLSVSARADLKRFTGQMRALGLIDKHTDLLKESQQLRTNGTAAFYDSNSDDIVVFGTKIDVAARVTLVHEMTHALQDQHFNLSRNFDSDGQSALFQALAEGDATRIENAYVGELSKADGAEYEKSFASSNAEHGSVDVAPTLEQLFGAPYVLGDPMTTLFEQVKGTKALDALFKHPVPSDEGLLNIFPLLDNQKPKRVSAPKLNSGEKLTDKASSFGNLVWYLMLASHIDEKTALRAVDGWGGDASVGYSKDGRDCIRAAFVGDTANETKEMRAALTTWKTSFPADRVTVTGDTNRVEVSACEPDVIPAPRTGAGNSLVLPVSRLQFLSGAYSSGATRSNVECLSREFLKQVTIPALLRAEKDSSEFVAQARNMARVCSKESAA